MKRNPAFLTILAAAFVALLGGATGAMAAPIVCPSGFTCTGGTSGNGLTFLASFSPGNQSPGTIAADVLLFLSDNGIMADYLGRAGNSSTFILGDNVSVSGGGTTGTWSFSPGTTNDIAAYVAIHAGEGQTDYLFSIDAPGTSGTWGTNNGHGLSNFDLFGIDPPAAVPEPMTLAVFGAGLVGAGLLRRRKQRNA